MHINVLGSEYSRKSRTEINREILAIAAATANLGAAAPPQGYVCVSNVHTTMMGWMDADYQKITNEARFAVPDGMPLVWAMTLLGAPEQDRVRGPTLMREICDLGRALGLKHYLLGGSEQALAALEKYLGEQYPGVQIVGRESPPYRPATAEEIQARVARINASGAQLLWVGLGAPKQERWMYEQRHIIRPLMLGVGAAFDLLPGLVPEAPTFLQNLGLEWAYRLYREPRRLWKRYVINNPLFVILLTWQVICSKFSRS